MNELALRALSLPPMNEADIGRIRALQAIEAHQPQVALDTDHVLHAGLYSRTIRLPDGVMLTGALIKIATLVIVDGDVIVWMGENSARLCGHNVLPASAGRKQAFYALTESFLTMIFPTSARSVEEAERQFTDEAAMLASRRAETPNTIVITGE